MNHDKTVEDPPVALDERAIARKHGLRELTPPDSEQVKMLVAFLRQSIDAGRCGPVPRTAVVVVLDYLQGTLNRHHITKGPKMTTAEFDLLQTPYYVAARAISRIRRRHEDTDARTGLYQTTYSALNQFIEVLHSLIDPGCYWLRMKTLPDGVKEAMDGLREFLVLYPEQRKKGRAL